MGVVLGLTGVARAGDEALSGIDQIGEEGGLMCKSPELYTPKPNTGAKKQIVDLLVHGKFQDANLIRKMVETPQAVWFTQGTPSEVQHDVHVTVSRARNQGTPVLVAYNIPFRDCAQFSAGGATNAAEYAAWIDGFAKGIGNSPAIVILEPDGLGIIPWFIPYYPNPADPYEWCRPAEANKDTAASDRFAMMNAAVERIKQQPNVKVYLDATHATWLGVGEASHRLILAGIAKADGFFQNVSNYIVTENSIHFGNWVSSCIAYTLGIEWGWDASWCAGQYAPDANGVYVPTYTPEHIAEVYGSYTWGPQATIPFVIDTSRNGVGDWSAPADHPAGDPQVWCDPPNRALGLRPTLNTGKPLVDAYLWIKLPGESDGQCNRWNPAGGIDPVRNMMDPAAGKWFPEMALELAHNAVPPL
jgi:endoglucanase